MDVIKTNQNKGKYGDMIEKLEFRQLVNTIAAIQCYCIH